MKIFFLLASLFLFASCTSSSSSLSGEHGVPTPAKSVEAKVLIPSPTYGSGSKTMTIYADFQCPACIGFSKNIGPIFEDYASRGKLTITYKQYPLTNIHRNAERDAIAGLCAAEQGHYMDYKKNLYALEAGKSGAKVTDSERVSAAVGTPLDASKLTECLIADTYLPQVRAEMAEGDAAGVTGTPTIFLDGRKLDITLFNNTETLKNFMDKYLGIISTSASGIVK